MIDYRDPTQPPAARAEALLAQMTLAEKIGQMTQPEKNSVSPEQVRGFALGSVLSGGGGYPTPNTPEAWLQMVTAFQKAALGTRLGIPLLYGVDAVHGHNNLRGATLFPHNIGLGAARDAALVEQIGRATALEMAATGILWNFAPTLAVVQDIRWGRTYESFGADTGLVTELGAAYVRGLQSTRPQVTATAKHYLGDGATVYGTSRMVMLGYHYLLDQGDVQLDDAALRALCLPPYRAALAEGALTVMASFNSWQGLKLHAHPYLLTEVLKGELGLEGFVVSDWQAIDQVHPDYHTAVVLCLNAGVDMSMVPFDFRRFIVEATRAVENGEIPLARIDDAVHRILAVKFRLGLFEHPLTDPAGLSNVGSAEHRALAREAVSRSLVLLKNEGGALPIARETPRLHVGGVGAADLGLQCGGWSIDWLGGRGAITPGTTLLEGLCQAASPHTAVTYHPLGEFDTRAEVGVAVVSEAPYAEGMGDRADLALSAEDMALIRRMRARCDRLVLVVLAGRPLVLTGALPLVDALVAAWLPGTEGAGVADVLFGDCPFAGRLPFAWPRSPDQLPGDSEAGGEPLFPYGFGLA
jgi:beta-glucosidase